MASSRAPFVAVRTDIRKEERVRFIADHAGYNEDEAVGKLVRLWCWCTDRGLEDAPDDCEGYAVPDAVVRRFLGPLGVEAILGDGCDELAMGERRSIDGLIYLRGTADTVDRLRSLRASSLAGGRGRAEKARREGGRFAPNIVAQTTDHQPSATSPAPAGTSDHQRDPRSQIPDPEILDQSLSHAGARARPAAPAPRPAPAPAPQRVDRPPSAGGYDDQDPRARGQLAEATYRRVSDARLAIAAELKLPAPLPFPPIGPSSRAGSFRELLDRVREEGAAAPLVCDRVVSNLIAQAREERAIEWLAEKAFSTGPWRTAREWMPGAAARRRGPARGDPIPHATPPRRPDPPRPPPVSEAERAEAAAVLAEARARMFGTPPIDDDTDEPRRNAL